jgi:hypothetical protein
MREGSVERCIPKRFGAPLGPENSQLLHARVGGFWATTGPGPINFIDVHPHVETAFPHDVTVSVDWIFQWRESLQDEVYAVPGFLIRAADGSRARFVGHRPGAEIRWQANRHLWFQADYGIFYAGRFLKETQPGFSTAGLCGPATSFEESTPIFRQRDALVRIA